MNDEKLKEIKMKDYQTASNRLESLKPNYWLTRHGVEQLKLIWSK